MGLGNNIADKSTNRKCNDINLYYILYLGHLFHRVTAPGLEFLRITAMNYTCRLFCISFLNNAPVAKKMFGACSVNVYSFFRRAARFGGVGRCGNLCPILVRFSTELASANVILL